MFPLLKIIHSNEDCIMKSRVMTASVSLAVFLAALLAGSVVAQAADVKIDVRPGDSRNVVNPNSHGMIPVALLGAADFDVQGVAVTSLSLSAQGSSTSAQPKGPGRIQDVNGDGIKDVVLLFSVQSTGVKAGDTQLCLAGPGFQACDAIVTVPAK
jgi:hypothetical protein